MKKTLEQRIEELEQEVERLKARPQIQFIPYPVYQPIYPQPIYVQPYYPYPTYPPIYGNYGMLGSSQGISGLLGAAF